jgi:hypothetical protein
MARRNFLSQWIVCPLLMYFISALQMAHSEILKVIPSETSTNEVGLYSFQDAVERAKEGDTILLGAGNYKLGVGMSLVGTPEKPIKIVGTGTNTKIELIAKDKKFCLAFKDSHFVELHNLHFSNCGELFVFIQNSTYFTFKNIVFVGGRFPIYATGEHTHHILMDSIFWNQDPAGRVYGEIPWSESHHGNYAHLNGSIIYASGIAGSVILRNSTIKNAFNGIRMKGVKEKIGLTNMNVEIYNNFFENIRDNPVEPEVDATNWWVHHNKIKDAHAYFSFTGVAGGQWYIFRNIGISEKVLIGEHSGGKILKFENYGPLPTGPFLVFNNSWLGQRPIATGGESRNLQYINNAHQFTRSIIPMSDKIYHDSYQIKNNLLNVPFKIYHLVAANIYHPDFQFQDNIDLRTTHQDLIDKGVEIKVNDYVVKFSGKAPDIGAYEHNGFSDYPPYRFNESGYKEYPRIVKIDKTGEASLTLWSSVKLSEQKQLYATAIYKNGKSVRVQIRVKDYSIFLNSFDTELLDEIQLPPVVGLNNLEMLTWGATEANFKITILGASEK